MVLVNYRGNPDYNDVTSRLDSLKALTYYLVCILTAGLTVESSDVLEGVSFFEGLIFMSFWDNLGFPIMA